MSDINFGRKDFPFIKGTVAASAPKMRMKMCLTL